MRHSEWGGLLAVPLALLLAIVAAACSGDDERHLQIVFDSERAGNQDIFVMRDDGKEVRQLTDNADLDRCPHWSPDGKLIAFYSDRNGDREIYVMNADGSGVRQVTDAPGNDEVPNWLAEP